MFFRVKLVGIFLGVVLVLLGTVQLLFLGPIRAELEDRARAQVGVAAQQAAALMQTDMLAVRSLAEEVASQSAVSQALAVSCVGVTDVVECEERRHNDVVAALQSWFGTLHAGLARNRNVQLVAREPSLVFPLEPTLLMAAEPNGVVLGRTIGDVSDWWGSTAPNLIDTLDVADEVVRVGRTQHALVGWREEVNEPPKLTLVAAAAVHDVEGRQVGLVVLGFPVNDQLARDQQQLLGNTSLAYLLGDAIEGTSRRPEEARDLREASFTLVGADEAVSFSAAASAPAGFYLAEGKRDSYVVGFGRFDDDPESPVRFLVAASLAEALAPTSGVAVGLPVLGLLILVIGLLALVVVVRNFLDPLVKIDQGIQQVIAGNRDFVWTTTSDNPFHAEMAHALNVMSAFLQGKPLPDDEDDAQGDGEWEALLQFADVNITGARPVTKKPTGLLRKLEVDEPEPLEVFHRHLFDDYVAARKEVGATDENITYDRFVAQVRKNAEAYREAHKCRDVRFQVVVKEGRVVLKPLPID